jgi:thiamine biosynthesis lipoprotein
MPAPEVAAAPGLQRWETTAMASAVTLLAPDDSPAVQRAVARAWAVLKAVEATCSRFDSHSALTRLNGNPHRWHRVPDVLFDALRESHQAYVATAGAFDPRVHDTLVALGYDRSFHLGPGPVTASPGAREGLADIWRPSFVRRLRLARVGSHRLDLGGIGKGLALRWAAAQIRETTPDFLLEAGGDCYASGSPGSGPAWRIGVESPSGEPGPVAVLEARDAAVATSSIRVRRWQDGDRTFHHLIDPRTGTPGGGELASVTVVHPDAARAEVWSKASFLAGRDHIESFTTDHRIAALWVDGVGGVRCNRLMASHLIWTNR